MMTSTKNSPLFSTRSQNLPSSFIRDILKVASQGDYISFAGGLPDPSLFPLKELEASTAEIFRLYGTTLLQYTRSEGLLSLREWICSYYRETYQMKVLPEQVLITSGSQQALDLVGKIFLNPGDQLILEQPSYLGAIQAFMAYEPEILPLDIEPDGPDIAELEKLILFNRPKMLYLVSNFQNPSCSVISAEKRESIGRLAEKHNLIVVEDDPYGQLRFEGEDIKPIRSWYSSSILCGSFSKIIAPGLRIGWVVADEDVIQKLLVMKQASDLHSNNLSQFIADHYLRNYPFHHHIRSIRSNYGEKGRHMFKIASALFPAGTFISKPEGGMFLWVELPTHIDAELLLRECMKDKIVFVPGKYFFTNGKGQNTLRLNFTSGTMESISKGIGIMAKALKKMLAEKEIKAG